MSQNTAYTNLAGAGWAVNGVPLIPNIGGLPFTGNWYFVQPASGSDGNPGTADAPLATLYRAHALCTAGNNDVVVLVGDGATTGTARLSTALAQSVDSSATTGTLTWSKNATHLIGATAPTAFAQRARIAPPSATYTQSTFGSGNFIVISASGCMFANFSIFNGFSTGGTNQIAVTVTGSRNFFSNVNIGGMADTTSAADAGSRSLKIGSGGSGENTFNGCTIGLDTVTRSAANASVEFAGATPRNVFRSCIFPFQTSSATVLGYIGTGTECMDRAQYFLNCAFVNNIQSTSTAMTGLGTLPASAGGLLYFDATTTILGVGEFGTDATTRGQCYVGSAAPSASAGGIAVSPT